MTVTLEQSIGPSSGSVTVTLKGSLSPNLNRAPSAGTVIFTLGAVLPTTTRTEELPVFPSGSVTVSVAV